MVFNRFQLVPDYLNQLRGISLSVNLFPRRFFFIGTVVFLAPLLDKWVLSTWWINISLNQFKPVSLTVQEQIYLGSILTVFKLKWIGNWALDVVFNHFFLIAIKILCHSQNWFFSAHGNWRADFVVWLQIQSFVFDSIPFFDNLDKIAGKILYFRTRLNRFIFIWIKFWCYVEIEQFFYPIWPFFDQIERKCVGIFAF